MYGMILGLSDTVEDVYVRLDVVTLDIGDWFEGAVERSLSHLGYVTRDHDNQANAPSFCQVGIITIGWAAVAARLTANLAINNPGAAPSLVPALGFEDEPGRLKA